MIEFFFFFFPGADRISFSSDLSSDDAEIRARKVSEAVVSTFSSVASIFQYPKSNFSGIIVTHSNSNLLQIEFFSFQVWLKIRLVQHTGYLMTAYITALYANANFVMRTECSWRTFIIAEIAEKAFAPNAR